MSSVLSVSVVAEFRLPTAPRRVVWPSISMASAGDNSGKTLNSSERFRIHGRQDQANTANSTLRERPPRSRTGGRGGQGNAHPVPHAERALRDDAQAVVRSRDQAKNRYSYIDSAISSSWLYGRVSLVML